MQKKYFVNPLRVVRFLAIVSAFLIGCASSQGGHFDQSTGTGINLSKSNYKIIKTSATGVSTGFNLLGFIPLASPSYADAKKKLYASVGESLTGRSVALANQTEDRSTIYLIIFSFPKLTISADVIEFREE